MPLPRCSLVEARVDPAGVADFIAACESAPGLQLHSLLILRERRVCFEAHWAPYTADRPRLLYSLSKMFLSAATGLAVADGAFGYDDPIAGLFADAVDPASVGPKARTIRVRDCLSMTTGHAVDLDPTPALLAPGLTGLASWLRTEPTGTVGETFCYHQYAPYACSAAISHRTGRDAHTLLTERVFDRLGADPGWWTRDAGGRAWGWSHLHLPPESIAAFARLIDDGGVHDGEQLLPPEWLAEFSRPHARTDAETNPDWRYGYGWQVWLSRHGFRGDGAYGQFCLFWPDADAIVVLTGATENMQGVLDRVWDHLYPAFDRAPTGDEAALLETTRTLALATPTTDADGPASLTAAGPAGDVELTRAGDGWTLCWRDARGGDSTFAVGAGGWVEGELTFPAHTLPVAAAGGFADGAFTARLVLTSTPHAALLTLRDGRATLRWETMPLVGAEPALVALTSGTPRPDGDLDTARHLVAWGSPTGHGREYR
nr:serine hydrolase [Propionibacterium sp.]